MLAWLLFLLHTGVSFTAKSFNNCCAYNLSRALPNGSYSLEPCVQKWVVTKGIGGGKTMVHIVTFKNLFRFRNSEPQAPYKLLGSTED